MQNKNNLLSLFSKLLFYSISLKFFHEQKKSTMNDCFFTLVEIPPAKQEINYLHKLMMLGSCFSENIGKKLKEAFFQVDVNPFGVLYNPLSIAMSLERLIENKGFSRSDIFEYQSLWHSFFHSSSFSDVSPEKTLSNIQTRFDESCSFLKKTDFLLLTFGTAWVFEDRKTQSVVSNCHKLPSQHFNRRRLSIEEIVEHYTLLIAQLQQLNPSLRIIFTVSPIRHWKDGPHENNLSKSILLLSVEELQKKFKNVDYFPAYEIQMDELRDYRFYASDMLHPSETAINYIWEKFSDTYFSEQTKLIKQRMEHLTRQINHRALHPDSPQYFHFQEQIENEKEALRSEFPFLKGLI